VAFGVEWAEQPVQFFGVIPMKGKTLAIGISVVLLLSVALNGDWLHGAGYVAAMIAALIFSGSGSTLLLRIRRARLKWRMRNYPVPQAGIPPPRPRKGDGRRDDKQRWLN